MNKLFRTLPLAALILAAACSDDVTGVAPLDVPGPRFHHTAAPANVQISPAGTLVEGTVVSVLWDAGTNANYGVQLEKDVLGVWTDVPQPGHVSGTSRELGALGAGTYRVRVNSHQGNPGSSWSALVHFVVNPAGGSGPVDTRAPQSITGFAAPLNVTYGDHDFTFAPAASSGRAVTLTATGDCALIDVAGEPLASATAPGTVRVTGAGSCSVTAEQAGDAATDGAWLPVSEMIQFAVARAALTVTARDESKVYDGAPFPAADFAVGYTGWVRTDGPALLGGALAFGGDAVGAVNAGTYAIVPSGLVADDYTITFVAGELEITKAPQAIVFSALAGRTFGDAAFAISATGGASSNPVTFAAVGRCSVAEDVNGDWSVSILGAGSCTITASQAGSANYFAALDVAQAFMIAKAQAAVSLANLSHVWDGNGKAATVSTTPSPLNVTLTYDGGSALPVAPGTYAVLATVVDDDYEGSATGALVISAWRISGFHRPVAMTPAGGTIVYNSAKAGSTVPLKFNVFAGGIERTDVAAIGGLSAQKLACEAGIASADDVSSTNATGLRYSGTPGVDGHFIQNWQTPKSAGCYRALITALDGSTIEAYFNLK